MPARGQRLSLCTASGPRWHPDRDRLLACPECGVERRRREAFVASSTMEARDIRAHRAEHSTSATALERLASDPDVAVAARVAANPRAPAALLSRLSRHPRREVREASAANTSTPAVALGAMIVDRVESVRRAAIMNPSTPDDALGAARRDRVLHGLAGGMVDALVLQRACRWRMARALGIDQRNTDAIDALMSDPTLEWWAPVVPLGVELILVLYPNP